MEPANVSIRRSDENVQTSSPRIAPVTAAFALLWLYALVQLASAAVTWFGVENAVSGVTTTGPGSALAIESLRNGSLAGVAVAILLAVWAVALVSRLRRRSRLARVALNVIAGLAILRHFLGTWGVTELSLSAGNTGDPAADKLQQQLLDTVPGWFTLTGVAASVLSCVLLVAVLALLAQPAAKRFLGVPEERPLLEPGVEPGVPTVPPAWYQPPQGQPPGPL